MESLIKGKDGLVRGTVVKSATPKKGNPTRLRHPLQRLYPLDLGTLSQANSTAPDVSTETEHVDVRPRQGAAGIADIPDLLD